MAVRSNAGATTTPAYSDSSHCTRTPNLLTLRTVPVEPVRFMRTRWPGFAAFHSGHVAVVEFISGVWRCRRFFARCVGVRRAPPLVAVSDPAADPVADAVARRAGPARGGSQNRGTTYRGKRSITKMVCKSSGRTAPLCYSRWANDRTPCALGVFECRADFVGGADVVGEFDARRAMSAKSRPKAKHHSSGLEEADFVVRLLGATPTESFIERPCPAQIVDAEGHETDAFAPSAHPCTWGAGNPTALGLGCPDCGGVGFLDSYGLT